MTTDTSPDQIDLMTEYERLRRDYGNSEYTAGRCEDGTGVQEARVLLDAFVSRLIALADAERVAQEKTT